MDQAQTDTTDDLASRLRGLRERNALTTQAMSDMTGIPKRTLESYMLKQNAPLPGLEALKRIALGLEISLDWLVFGGDKTGEDIARITRLSCRSAALPFLTEIRLRGMSGEQGLFDNGTIMGLSVEELAGEIAAKAGQKAQGLAEIGIRQETLKPAERFFDAQIKNSKRKVIP